MVRARVTDEVPGGTVSIRSGRSSALLEDLRAIAVPWITARALIVTGFLAAYAIVDRLVPDARPNAITEGLVAWDGTWYRDIASHGYGALGHEGLRFFPLFPLLGKALSIVTLGRTDVALVIIANIASVALAVAIRRLVRFERGSVDLADRAVWIVCLFPGAFVLAWAYAEALWLLAAVVVFWAVRSRRWGWAILAGLVAGATRPLGILLVVPIAIEAVRVWRAARNDERLLGLGALVAPIVGTGGYLLWVGSRFGDAWLPFTVQGTLRGNSDPLSRLWEGIGQMFGPDRLSDGLHIPFAIAFVALVVLSFRYWPASYGAFAAVVMLAALDAENLNSLERYGLNAFPIALTLAVVVRRPAVERVAMIVLGGGMVALTAMAWTGTYVP